MKRSSARIVLPLLAGCLASAQIGKVPPALAAIQAELAVSLVHAGWIATAINASAAALGVFVGLMLARAGVVQGLILGLLLLGLGSALGALAPDTRTLIAARAFEGIGFVLIVVAAPSVLAHESANSPARRRLVLSLWSCYMPTGMALMMALAPLILDRHGWRGLWSFNAALLAITLLGALSMRRAPAAESRRPLPPQVLERMFAAPRILRPIPWLMGTCFGCYAAIWFMIATWLPTFAVANMGYTPRDATWLTAIAVAGNIAGNLSAGFWRARGIPRWALMAAVMLLMGGLGWFVFSAAYSPQARSFAAVVACSAGGILPAIVMGAIPLYARSPADIAIGNGIVMQCSNLGTFVGVPALAALATTLGGWDGGRWLIPGLAGLGALAALALRAVEARQAQAEPPDAVGVLAEQS